MSARTVSQLSKLSNRVCLTSARRSFAGARSFATLPESIARGSNSTASFPNEYPGQNYDFNWTLNGDGVTPTKKSAFRITKPLELKIAGLKPLKKTPLKVNAASSKKSMIEAGSDALDFDSYDEISQRCKDLLSMSDSLFCPEGFMPSSSTSVRIITNSGTLAPKLLAYLERAPKRDSKGCSITAYVMEDAQMDNFGAYAIEEVGEGDNITSVAAVVCTGNSVSVEQVVAGLEMSLDGLKEDEAARKVDSEEAGSE